MTDEEWADCAKRYRVTWPAAPFDDAIAAGWFDIWAQLPQVDYLDVTPAIADLALQHDTGPSMALVAKASEKRRLERIHTRQREDDTPASAGDAQRWLAVMQARTATHGTDHPVEAYMLSVADERRVAAWERREPDVPDPLEQLAAAERILGEHEVVKLPRSATPTPADEPTPVGESLVAAAAAGFTPEARRRS